MKRHQYISPEKILTGERCAGQRVKDGGKPEEIEKGTMKQSYILPFHVSYFQVRERQETREAKPGLSDDDKIRLQLYVDVHFLLGKLTEIGAIKEVTPNFFFQQLRHTFRVARVRRTSRMWLMNLLLSSSKMSRTSKIILLCLLHMINL